MNIAYEPVSKAPVQRWKYGEKEYYTVGLEAKFQNHLDGVISMVMSYLSLPFMPMACDWCGL